MGSAKARIFFLNVLRIASPRIPQREARGRLARDELARAMNLRASARVVEKAVSMPSCPASCGRPATTDKPKVGPDKRACRSRMSLDR
jgi:hypothetical protein